MPAKLLAIGLFLCASLPLRAASSSTHSTDACNGHAGTVATSYFAVIGNVVRNVVHGYVTGLGYKAVSQLYKDIEALNLPPEARKQLDEVARRTGFNLSLPDLDLVKALPIDKRIELFTVLINVRQSKGELNFYGPAVPKNPHGFSGNTKTDDPINYAKERAMHGVDEFGTGTGGSQLLDGTIALHNDFAKAISTLLGTPDTLLVSTGDHARNGWVTSIVKKGDTVLIADYSSPVTKDGLFKNKVRSAGFNTLPELDNHLSEFFSKKGNRHRNAFIAVPSVSYADGSHPNLRAISILVEKYTKQGFSVKVVVDESLAIGKEGPNGAGMVAKYGLQNNPAFLITGSLNENFGVDAGFVSGPAQMIRYNKFYMDHHMFSSSLSPTDASTGLAQVELLLAGRPLAKPVDAQSALSEPVIPPYEGPTGRMSSWVAADGTQREAIPAGSNAYLGAQWHKAVKDYTKKFIATFGSITGKRHAIHDKLEDALSKFFGFAKIVLVRTGFDANLVMRMLPQKGDLVLIDHDSHKSTKDAIKDGRLYVLPKEGETPPSSPAETFYRREFEHNSVAEAQAVIEAFLKENPGKKVYVGVESAYSMLGDTMNPEFVKLLANPNVFLVVDEAHGIGVLGPTGKGGLHTLGANTHPNAIFVGTGSKALPSKFGFIGASKEIGDRLQAEFDKRYGGLAPTSIANAAAGYAGLKLLEGQPERVGQLQNNRDRLRQGLRNLGIDVSITDEGAVVPVKAKDNRVNVNQMQRGLERLEANAVRANVAERPAVTIKILRFSVTAEMTPAQIDAIITDVAKFQSQLK